MADLGVHVGEPVIRNDLRRVEVLEFGGVGSRFLCQADQKPGAFQIAVMVRSNVRDKVGRMVQADGAVAKVDLHCFLLLLK